MKQRSKDLLKMLMNTYERIARKLELQKGELAQCGEREVFRVRGDVVSANIYRMEKGMTELTAEAPEAEMMDYTIVLRAMTQGRGQFEFNFVRYEEVPSNEAQKIIAAAKLEDDED